MDSRPATIHPKFIENVFGVGAQGVQGHDQFAGNFWTTQFGSEKHEYVQFTLAQWLNDCRLLTFGCGIAVGRAKAARSLST